MQVISRRQFLWLSAMSTAGFAAGCVVNPVTGQMQLMLVSENEEIKIDRQNAPHQFSADYGIYQDSALNQYINSVGKNIASKTHRPKMPYSFRAVNATYVNAYAFPGGTIAVTRGLLLQMKNEAELASLLGHELGHVNARHTAEQMSKGMLTSVIIGGATAFIQNSEHAKYAPIVSSLGMIGSGILLAKYSRDNERQADQLGMEYMVKANYNPDGSIGLMNILRNLSKHQPNVIEMMFASHPMSDERYQTAIAQRKQYANVRNAKVNQERYMDNTASIRSMKDAIESMQQADTLMAQGQAPQAESVLMSALKQDSQDYTALVMMAKCKFAQNKFSDAFNFVQEARGVYPNEGQAIHISGMIQVKQKQFESAYQHFILYEKVLPGNPNTIFYKGYSLEGMQRIDSASDQYSKFLNIVNEGNEAQYAYKRLVEWGKIKPKST